MGLFVEGMLCQICGQPIVGRQEITSLPSLGSDTNDPLFVYGDCTFHTGCIARLGVYPEIQERVNRIVEMTRNRPPKCDICGQPIQHWNDIVAFTRLTSETSGILSGFCYKQFHKQCLKHDDRLPDLTLALRRLHSSGEWGGEQLELWLSDIDHL